ncbi:MAG TPA: arginase family protein [Thermoplasmata archaeon]
MARPLAVLDAPSNLGLRPPRPGAVPGVARMPKALRERRLLQRLGAEDGGRVDPPAYSPEPDVATGFRNGTSLQEYSTRLAARLRELVRSGRFPLVLGGDCSVLIGAMLGLKSLGRYGLIFLDGHDDFSPIRDPEKYRGLFAAAGCDLALVTGHGPDALGNLEGAQPYVAEEDVVLFGFYRDPEDSRYYDTKKIDSTAMHQIRVEQVRERGARASAEEALRQLGSRDLDGFWIHVDADVLDRSVMPAVDSPNPNGLLHAELSDALHVLLSSPKAAGIEFTIYDPELDPSGTCGDALVETIVRAFPHRPAARSRSLGPAP